MSRVHRILSKADRDGTTRHVVPALESFRSPVPADRDPDDSFDHGPRRLAWTRTEGPAANRPPIETTPVDTTMPAPMGLTAPITGRPVFGAELSRDMVAALSPFSPAAEQYRSLRTRIAQTEGTGARRVHHVSSPGRGDGKTVTVANLALTMAQEFQRRVVLIDGDLRNGRLHEAFGIEREPGLSDVLTGAAPLEDALASLSEYRLMVIPAGRPHDRPAELLGSEPMRRLVEGLARRFDRVLLDSRAAHFADAGVLEPLADGVLLVVRSGRTPRPAIARALGLVPRTKLLGLVMNDARTSGR
jgi:capsular exopolysaccharide synthesis family protein